mmetsp:Transcript_8950/g.27179  ORF Transcript_8950/g.27179 Transcript_8950/m.27179 type:complete len:213 (+) Transcript_8950:170-808(+)
MSSRHAARELETMLMHCIYTCVSLLHPGPLLTALLLRKGPLCAHDVHEICGKVLQGTARIRQEPRAPLVCHHRLQDGLDAPGAHGSQLDVGLSGAEVCEGAAGLLLHPHAGGVVPHREHDGLDPAQGSDVRLVLIVSSQVPKCTAGLLLHVRGKRVPLHRCEDQVDAAGARDLDPVVGARGEVLQRAAGLLLHRRHRGVRLHRREYNLDGAD